MAEFDADAARKAGHSEADIARIQRGIAAARAAGYSDEEIRAHLGGGGSGAKEAASPPTAAPTPVTGTLSYEEPPGASTAAPPVPAPSPLLHYPAMVGQTLANGALAAINAPGELSGLINHYTAPFLPRVLTTPVGELPALLRGDKTSTDTGAGGTVPYVDLGDIAKPQGAAESYANAALGGLAAAGTMGGVTRLPALLQKGASIARELPRLLREAGVLGAVPATAVEAANQNGVMDNLGPETRTAAEALLGGAVGIASHHFLSGDPVESVAKGLGRAGDSDQAGSHTQDAVREWREALPAKLDALKATTLEPEADNPDVTSEHVFGKVPLSTATSDMSSTLAMTRALAAKGGVFGPVLEQFGSDMPKMMRDLIESIGQRNNPIETYSPKKPVYAGPTSAGPVEENPPQMTRPYEPGPTTPESTAVVPHQTNKGEVGFHIPEPEAPAGYKEPLGTMTGFQAPLRDAMELRSYIGELTSRGMMPKGSTEAQWSGLYKALSEDIGNTMSRYGAKPDWDKYNAEASKLYTAGNTLAKFSNDVNETKDTAEPGKATKALWSKMESDSGAIRTLREQVPAAADELAAGFLRSQPEKWNKLPQATREALVPNPFDRLVLNSSVAKKPSLAEIQSRTSEHIGGGSAGYALGELLRPHGDAEGSTSLMSPQMWTALGIMTPTLLHYAGKLKQNPRAMNVPIAGGIAGVAGQGGTGGTFPSPAASSPLLNAK